MALTIPADYGYVLGTAFSSAIVSFWITYQVTKARIAAKVPYPNAYSTPAEIKDDKAKYLFNCAQRAHANYLEHWPSFLIGLFGGGLKYPIASSLMGAVWISARVLYTIGYNKKDEVEGKGRKIGNFFYLPEFGLLILAAVTAFQTVTA